MTNPRIAVIGAGFAGLGAAVSLRRAGFGDVTVFDRGDEVGGTWRDNTYPGCACDIRSHLYSFSWFRNPDWTREYPSQPEILAYLRAVADHFGLRPHLRLGTEITELRWDDASRTWGVHTSDSQVHTFDVVVNGTGPLSQPSVPELPGLDRFAGPSFHSARWDHEVDLLGRRVGLVGTGASAIQIAPAIVDATEQLVIFQRSAPWIVGRGDHLIPVRQRRRYRRWPLLSRLHRSRIYLENEAQVAAFLGSRAANDVARRQATAHLEAQVTDPERRERLRPRYAPGCKRILVSDDWYPTAVMGGVEVVTDPIDAVTPTGVRAGGVDHDLDVLVLATGFAATDFLTPMKVFGRDGVELSEAWRAGAATHLGLAVSGFPNLWLLLGPNTVLGHNSMVLMIEAQLHTVVGALRAQCREQVRAWEVRAEVQRRSYERVQRRMAHTVWASGCESWYLGPDHRNDTIWPATTAEYWWRTRRFDPRAYRALR